MINIMVPIAIALFLASRVPHSADWSPPPAPRSPQILTSSPSPIVLENQKFRHQIASTLLDKLVIGGLIVLLTLLTSQRLEHFKSREAYISAFTQDHVNKVAAIWKLMYEWEACIDAVHAFEPPELFESDEREARINREVAHSRELATQLRAFINRERFWLGQKLYQRFANYHNLLHPYLDAVLLNDRTLGPAIKNRLNTYKQDIMGIVNARLS